MRLASGMVLFAWLSVCLCAHPQATLADRLVAAASDEERMRLVDDAGSSLDAGLLAELQRRADTAFAASRFPAASPIYSAVLVVAERLHDAPSAARAQWNMGRCFGRIGKDSEAIERFKQSLAISTAAKLDSISALTLRSLSSSERTLNNFPEAIDAAQRSLELYRALDDQNGISGSQLCAGKYVLLHGRVPACGGVL